MKKIIISAIVALGILVIAGSLYAATITRANGPVYLYQWYSTNPAVAGVNSQTGLVTPVWTGTADICAQLKTDLSVKFCNTVTVQ